MTEQEPDTGLPIYRVTNEALFVCRFIYLENLVLLTSLMNIRNEHSCMKLVNFRTQIGRIL